eukprot:COSAG01_NODE_8071_length_2932_cov_3.224144_1_plen_51_part_00
MARAAAATPLERQEQGRLQSSKFGSIKWGQVRWLYCARSGCEFPMQCLFL